MNVRGLDVDAESRCRHYHLLVDVLAIRMHCCGEYFACRECHDALADHPASLWPVDQRDTLALACGACQHEQTIAAYLASSDRCPNCDARFNPGCRGHHHRYFAS